MADYRLENEELAVKVVSLGAELKSIVKKSTGQEYMWKADPEFWGRTSPILFPFIGNCREGKYRYEGKEYAASKHGFARNMEFTCISETKEELWFSISDTEETRENYPFAFELQIGYRLEKNRLSVLWLVKNKNEKTMYFAIGGHPAFNCPLKEGEKQTDYYIQFDVEDDLIYTMADENGLTAFKNNLLPLNEDDQTFRITENLFDRDALLIEDRQTRRISFLDCEKEPYVTVEMDTPVIGIWAPAGGKAPFICIEPWDGCCDQADFTGTLSERQYENSLEAGQEYKNSYSIIIN